MNSWEESIESFGIHVDPEKDEELEEAKICKYSSTKQPQSLQNYWRLWNSTRKTETQYKALLSAQCYPEGGLLWYGGQERLCNTLLIPEHEIDNKVTKFMKLAKNKNKDKKDGNSIENSEIVEFIQDFHRKYQSLYALYDNLRGEVREKVHGREEDKEGYSCSTSGLDLEQYYSPDEITSELQKVIDDLKQKLETSNLEVTNLRNKLISVSKEKEALNLEYLASLSNIQESEKIIKGLRIEAEHTKSTKQELVDESSQSKEKLEEREKELSYFTKSHQVHESEAAAWIKELENQVTSLKLEQETLCTQKKELEEQVQCKETEAKQVRDDNLVLESRILDLETASKEKEDELSALHKKFEENKNYLMSKIVNLMAQSNNLQMEVDTSQIQKAEFEDVCKSNEASAQVKDTTDQLNVLQEEPESLSSQKSELESNLEKQTQKISLFLIQIEHLTEKLASTSLNKQGMLEDKEDLKVRVKELKLEVDSLHSQKSELEKKLRCKDHKVNQLRVEKEGLHIRILDSFTTEKSQLELQNEREKQESLESLTQLEKHKMDSRSTDQQRTLEGQDKLILIKKFEDHLCPLSQRIQVAEQLLTENKNCYSKIKEIFEQEHVDLIERAATNEVATRKSKDSSLIANDMLTQLDSMVQRFGHCSENLLKQISKVSCGVKFAKDWAMREDNAIKRVKEESDCLQAQLDAKEAEIFGFRERVWELENKVRELEEMVKEKEEGMLSMGEEKREAIRQLCLWIDYHRNRFDFLKKLLTEVAVRTQRKP